MPLEPPLFTEGIASPPLARYTGPMIDAHTHTDAVADAQMLVQVAADFGIRVLCGVARVEGIADLRHAFGDRLYPIVRIDHRHIAEPARFAREGIRAVREAHALGAVAAKFWYAPRFVAESHLRFDNAVLRPVLKALVDHDMAALVHVADPDCWFRTRYADRARYGTKADYYEALQNVLSALPALKVQAAHMGGDPEHLDHLAQLLVAHPNLYLDTSATAWMARELSAKPAEARAFLIAHADRILFGSDLVAFKEATPPHYSSRYWVQRWLWEGDGVRPSPVADPCATAPEGPQAHGLNLPDDVLARLYAGNACRVHGICV